MATQNKKNLLNLYIPLIIKDINLLKILLSKPKIINSKIFLNFILLKKNFPIIIQQKEVNIFYQTLFSVKKLSVTNQWLLNIFFKNLSYYYLNIDLNWRFINILNTSTNKSFLLKLWYKIYKKKIFKIFYGNKKKTLSWFLQLYKLKDPQGIIFIIQNILTKARLKQHKKLFYLIGRFFKILFINKEQKNSLRGFTLFFKGKLGKKGSVRKSKFFVKYGLGSLTNKKLRLTYRTYVIITITGVVGCNICLFYH